MKWWMFNLLSITLYSLQLALAQKVVADFSPIYMTIIRTAPFLVLCFVFWGHVSEQTHKFIASDWKMQVTVLTIVLANLVGMVMMFSGVKASSSTHAAMISQLSIILVPIWCYLLFGQINFNVYTLAAAILIVSGVTILIMKG
ncbi:MAG: EamA family transporter [Alphaproteobacteria bacterium]